jgi:hypothetical protein
MFKRKKISKFVLHQHSSMSPPVLEVKKKKKGRGEGAGVGEANKRGTEGEAAGAGGAKRPKKDAGQAWEMGTDPVKGRIMVATRDLDVGEVILVEKPLVAASWHEHRCLECHEPHAASTCTEVSKRYPKAVACKMEEIEAALGTIDGLDELDISRRLIKLLNMARLEPARAELTRPCTAHNMDKCRAIIADIKAHKVARLILPGEVEDEEAARLLAVLNTNSHELGEWGGSGFFPLACLCEHSCKPNCAFNTSSSTELWIAVVRPVKKGSALSIDYCDATFEPTAERRAHLLQHYGFECACARCTSEPDLPRAFLCPEVGCEGKVCPVGLGKKPSDWKCLTCGVQLSKPVRKRFLKIESQLNEEGPQDLEEVDEVLEHDVFHETHHIVGQALVELGDLYAKDDDQIRSGGAEAIWLRVIAIAQQVLPEVHHRKAIFYDNLAQVRVAKGDLKGAKEALTQASHITELACGKDSPLRHSFCKVPFIVSNMYT